MPWGKVSASRWRRTVLAVAVMALATLGSLSVFVEGPSDNRWQENTVSQDADVAGRVDYPLPEQPEPITVAPEPVTISIMIDRSAPIPSYLYEAGLELDDARRWSALIQQAVGITEFQQGHALTLYKDPATSDLRGLKYHLNDQTAVRALNYGTGVIRVSKEPIKY